MINTYHPAPGGNLEDPVRLMCCSFSLDAPISDEMNRYRAESGLSVCELMQTTALIWDISEEK